MKSIIRELVDASKLEEEGMFRKTILALCVAVSLGLSGYALAGDDTLYSLPVWWSPGPDQLYTIDPSDGATIGSVALSSSDGPVEGGNGLAVDPTTNGLYAVLFVAGNRNLVTINAASGVTNRVGPLDAVRGMAGIAFDDSGTLYGVTGDGGGTPETLFTISLMDASRTFFMTLGNGDDGETIGFNPFDGKMYHASGIFVGEKVLESIDLSVPAIVNTVFILNDPPEELLSFTYAGGNTFFTADRCGNVPGCVTSGFFTLTPAGGTAFLGQMDHASKGLAIVPFCDPCDMNCDGVVDANDIEFFIDLLFNGATPCALCTGDTNGDGRVDAADIVGFIDCLF